MAFSAGVPHRSLGPQRAVQEPRDLELGQAGSEDGNIFVPRSLDHVFRDGPLVADDDGAYAYQGGDRYGVLVGLDGDERRAFNRLGHDVRQQVGRVRIDDGGRSLGGKDRLETKRDGKVCYVHACS